MKPIRVIQLIVLVVLIESLLFIFIAVSRPRVDAFLVSMQRTDYVDVEGKYPEAGNLVSIEFRFLVVNTGRAFANYAVFSDDFERVALNVDNDTNDYPHSVWTNTTGTCSITYLLKDNEETRGLSLKSFFVFYRRIMGDPTIVEKYRWSRLLFSILGGRFGRIKNL